MGVLNARTCIVEIVIGPDEANLQSGKTGTIYVSWHPTAQANPPGCQPHPPAINTLMIAPLVRGARFANPASSPRGGVRGHRCMQRGTASTVPPQALLAVSLAPPQIDSPRPVPDIQLDSATLNAGDSLVIRNQGTCQEPCIYRAQVHGVHHDDARVGAALAGRL